MNQAATSSIREEVDKYLTRFVETMILDGMKSGWTPGFIAEIGSRINVDPSYLLFRMNKAIADSSNSSSIWDNYVPPQWNDSIDWREQFHVNLISQLKHLTAELASGKVKVLTAGNMPEPPDVFQHHLVRCKIWFITSGSREIEPFVLAMSVPSAVRQADSETKHE